MATVTGRLPPIEIDSGLNLHAVTFLRDGKYLLSGDDDNVQVWRGEDGQRVATLELPRKAGRVCSLAASNDGKYIAAGTWFGDMFVWDADTYKQHFNHKVYLPAIHGVDFSPDRSRLVAASHDGKAYVLDLEIRERVQTLDHGNAVIAAKYSPHGDRIVTATQYSVRVYDSSNGQLLVDTEVTVTPWFNNGLFWSNNHLIVVSDRKIKQIDASTGSTLSEWSIPESDHMTPIALQKHNDFIAYSTKRTVTFRDTETQSQFGLIEHPQDIRSIALSPEGRSIAIAGSDGKIIMKSVLPITRQREPDEQSPTSGDHDDNSPDYSTEELRITDSISRPTFREPDLNIDDAILDLWERDQLIDAEASLTAAIAASLNTSHHLLASRALVRVRLRDWDAALMDAEIAIENEPSVMGYIAKSMALVGKGKRDGAYRTCDIAFAPFHSSHVCFLLLIKAIIVFMAREHLDAISRIDDIIATVPFNSIYSVVQAYMYLLIGNSRMEDNNYEGAIESFGRVQAKMRHDTSRALFVISLISGWKFENLGTTIRQRLCEAMYGAGRINDGVECFHEMTSESEGGTSLGGEQLEWAFDFRQRCLEKLAHLGDTAADAEQHDEAISHYTVALSLNPPSPQGILIKRGKAFLATGAWEQALDDASQVIMLDPSSPWGYEIKHAALHKTGDYGNAIDAFEIMLSKIVQSPDLGVQQHGDRYISPLTTRGTIHKIVQRTIRRSPRVLINTITGRLHDKSEQASAFESLPIFNELVSSMTTRIDYARIKREVRQYFRYVMLSHKWEKNEPLFQRVVHTAVYDLESSPTHDKLQTFCRIVKDDGFVWAWSDTCCIDKSDHFVLQEALVAMFKWYQGSALTIIFLRGVRSLSQLGALIRSIWNTRAWTLQEYIASKVVHFYTEDWTFYLNLQLQNHKESREIISEMEQATGVSGELLIGLRPGLTSIREKLCLASTRQTTLVEDAAYSLLGIFSVSGLPAIYGEGEGSLGRLLAHVLTDSGDVSVLAWTGESGSFNSCLPAYVIVYSGPVTSHLPLPLTNTDMERVVTTLQSSFDLEVALRLYGTLSKLRAPWLAGSRMQLPCIAFQLPSLSVFRTRPGRVYRVNTLAFGMVEIRTRHDLSQMKPLYLVHPWLDALLEPEDTHRNVFAEDDPGSPLDEENIDEELDEELVDGGSLLTPGPESLSHSTPVHMVSEPADRETRARRLVARLRQPFGALLVTPTGTGRRATPDYRRVAADSLITVQFQENLSLTDILDNVRTLDVL